MDQTLYLIGYVTTNNETKAATVATNAAFQKYDQAAFTSFGSLIQTKTSDQVKYVLGIQRLGSFTQAEVSQFNY